MLPLQYLTCSLNLKFKRAEVSGYFLRSYLYKLFWLPYMSFFQLSNTTKNESDFLQKQPDGITNKNNILGSNDTFVYCLKRLLKFFRENIFYSWFSFCGFSWSGKYPLLAAKFILTTNEFQTWEIIAWSKGGVTSNDWG